MRNFEDLSPEEKYKLVQKSIRESTGDQASPDQFKDRYIPMPNMEIAPPKPDPERDAEMAIRRSIEAAATKDINPETGMPFFRAPEPISPEEAKRREEMQMKAEFLRRRSQGQ